MKAYITELSPGSSKKSYHAFCGIFDIRTQLYSDLPWDGGQDDLAADAPKVAERMGIESLSER